MDLWIYGIREAQRGELGNYGSMEIWNYGDMEIWRS